MMWWIKTLLLLGCVTSIAKCQMNQTTLLRTTRTARITTTTATTTVTVPSLNATLRLVHPNACPTEGRLEIHLRGQWGTICNDNFNNQAATVACKQLGYVRGIYLSEVHHQGTGPIWLDEIACNTEDRRLIDCGHSDIGSHDCNHGEDVYIACFNGTRREYCPGSPIHENREGALRLRDGPCFAIGRLEIYHNNAWGTICDDGFGVEEATVACRELGYDRGVAIRAPSPGTGNIWLDDLACTLQHASIAECGAGRWGREDCSHSEDVGVHCYNSTSSIDCYGNPLPAEGTLRLQGGDCGHVGRLEIWHQRRWGTICDIGFDEADATTACRQLGHQRGWIHTAPPASSSTKIWVKNLGCTNQSRIDKCPHSTWGSISGCDHNKDVGVICSNTSARIDCTGSLINHTDGDLRLRDGDCAQHGRLEVYHNGRWGTVCDDSFTDIAATVACKELGYQMGYIKNAPPGTGITWLDNVACRSTDRRIVDCPHAAWGHEDCGHSEDIGIECYNGTGSLDCQGNPYPEDGGLRLTGDNCSYSGRLEIFHNGRWGTICSSGFDQSEIDLACRQLGHTRGILGANVGYTSAYSTTRIWLKYVACSSTDTRIADCRSSGWGSVSGCSHTMDVYITCTNSSDATDCNGRAVVNVEGQIRLVGGRNSSSGRLEIFHAGRWGTVCDDNFGRTDGTVACRELGFHTGNIASRTLAPDGTGPTWLDEVRCTSSNTRLVDCHRNDWGREDCSHSEDVRLLCTNRTECDSNPCQNGGNCKLGFNLYRCECQPGFIGTNCQINIDECARGPCENGGTCKDGINDYSCKCVLGYSGKNCSINVDDCMSTPCQHGATCFDQLNGFQCTCAAGFTGVVCETNINECLSLPCHSGGTCIDRVNSFECNCMPGFTGKICQTNMDECKSNPCKNNGTCLDGNNWFFCKCPPGFYGHLCQEAISPNSIGGRATTGKNVAPNNSPVIDQAAKGIAVAAIFLALIVLVIVIVIIVRFSGGMSLIRATAGRNRGRSDFRWKMLGRSPGASSNEGHEDEMAVWRGSSDKVNLVPT